MVFYWLTGKYNEISNYPGTTLDIARGIWQGLEVWDSPGVYSIFGANHEERIAAKIIKEADLVINVVDATRLHRDLFLTQQLLNLEKPVLVALNMMDEACAQGLELDHRALATILECPVVPITAVTGEGLSELSKGLKQKHFARPKGTPPTPEQLRLRANLMAKDFSVQQRPDYSTWDRTLIRPFPGLLIMMAVLAAVWWVMGRLVASNLVSISEELIMSGWVAPILTEILSNYLGPGLLQEVFIGPYGLVNMALVYSLGLLLPLVFSFYLLLSLLEDSGYLPRVAVLLDNLFSPLGLNGKAVIPMLLGFGCVTMAVISSRMLGTKRERLIITFLLGLAVPCSAQMGIIALLLVPLGLNWVLLYMAVIGGVFLLAGRLLNMGMPGETPGLYLELPRLRLPRLGNMFRKSAKRSWSFLKEAFPIFCVGSVLITGLNYTGLLHALGDYFAPVTMGWLKLPPELVNILLMGIVRRDFGAAGLYALALPPEQMFTALVTMTLFVPCLATILVAVREYGWLVGVLLWLGSMVCALFLGGLVAWLL